MFELNKSRKVKSYKVLVNAITVKRVTDSNSLYSTSSIVSTSDEQMYGCQSAGSLGRYSSNMNMGPGAIAIIHKVISKYIISLLLTPLI